MRDLLDELDPHAPHQPVVVLGDPRPPRRPVRERVGRERAELLGERVERARGRRPLFDAEVPPEPRELVGVAAGRPADLDHQAPNPPTLTS